MTCRRLSGSIRSPSAVEPETSQKRTVTVLRTSRTVAASASAAPQESQKAAPSRFSAPQLGQTTTRTSLGRLGPGLPPSAPAGGGRRAPTAGSRFDHVRLDRCSRPPPEGDQLVPLDRALRRPLEHRADAANVVLVV